MVLAQVEAMKAKHDVKAPHDGIVTDILVKIGDEIDSKKPILTLS
jgi:biotin carboxyl carrier protein